jgi:hypothetical protein
MQVDVFQIFYGVRDRHIIFGFLVLSARLHVAFMLMQKASKAQSGGQRSWYLHGLDGHYLS